jgi:hypothetical protein
MGRRELRTDHGTMGLQDYETTGLRTTGQRDYGPQDNGTIGPRDYGRGLKG